MTSVKEFDELIEIMHRLRKECPWDKEQNLSSLRRYLLEEAYECVAAIDELASTGAEPLIEELGDVLLQVLFQSELLTEQTNEPAILAVLNTLKSKLIRRHPHVFGNQEAKNAEAVLKRWDEIKKAEKGGSASGALANISRSLTALQLSQKFGERSKKVEFDWPNSKEVWQQVTSEIDELLQAKELDQKEEELGDVLFSLVQWARHEGLDAETALARTNRKFQRRFEKMEEIGGTEFASLPLEQKEMLWQQAKRFDKK
jgi:tetrapyrrole methylase family protein/MazG family protein